MFERLLPVFQADAPIKAARGVIERLPGQPVSGALEALNRVLREGLASSPGGPAARRLVALLGPVAREWAERGLAELASGGDNPVRRELIGRALALLADQLANTGYIEAVRESVALQKGAGRLLELQEQAAGHFLWQGLALTARALLDPQAAQVGWESAASLYLALVRHGGLPATVLAADREPARSLATLLLLHDGLAVVEAAEVAPVAWCCRQLAPAVRLAADFHRATPLVMDIEAAEAHRLVGWGGPSSAAPALCYGLEEAAAAAEEASAAYDFGRVPEGFLEPATTAKLLIRLATAWRDGPGRARNGAVARIHDAVAAFDFLRIRGLLGQKGGRLPAHDPFLRPVRIVDADDAGAALLLPADAGPLLAGGLLALHLPGRGWWPGRLARAEREADGGLFVTVRWLAQEADAVRLIIAHESLPALYLAPGPVNDYRPGMLLGAAALAPGEACSFERDGKVHRFVPSEAVALGPALWCYPGRLSP
ncbi:hypothetical protein [Chitinimonas koreensis]|uniref:hypothetical protein n=1 Tax=Chitinimonas koreensis TaxID=356302 RepID=UPI000491A6EE|nr:hypothetical protein [Chitinimonas koreensis]QNM95380.1 hypothetical protein H9L41_16095 [Chitinimonas koreensis]